MWIAQHGWLCQLLACSAVVLETAAPLALFSRRLRWIIAPGLLAMQLGISVLLDAFEPYYVLYAFWIPWDRILSDQSGAGDSNSEVIVQRIEMPHDSGLTQAA